MQMPGFIPSEMNSADIELIIRLYNREYQGLLDYAGYIVDNKSYSEDIVQEVFKIAIEKIADLRDSKNQVGWLYRTLQNVVRNKNRELRKPGRIVDKIIRFLPNFEPEMEVPFESQLIFFESYKDVLSKTDWTLLTERYCDGYHYNELAERHNLSVSACKMRILRAKSILRKVITKNL